MVAAEIKELRDALGFDHIGVVVGEIKETTKGKGKNAVLKRDFVAELYHMIEVKGSDKTGIIQRNYVWKQDNDKVLVWGAETTRLRNMRASLPFLQPRHRFWFSELTMFRLGRMMQ